MCEGLLYHFSLGSAAIWILHVNAKFICNRKKPKTLPLLNTVIPNYSGSNQIHEYIGQSTC